MMRILLLLLGFALAFHLQGQSLPFSKLHTYTVGAFDEDATEDISYDRISRRVFSTNKKNNAIDIITYSDFAKPGKVSSIDLNPYISSVTGVASFFGTVAVIGSGTVPQSPGKLLFFDKDGVFLAQFATGAKPQMVTFTPGGNFVIVANEGEPSDDYMSDPWGSVTLLDVSPGFNFISQSDVKTVFFDRLDTVAYDPLVRIYGNNGMQSPAEDVEPEFISVNTAQSKAYVSLQENNAIAIIDIFSASLDTVVGLGYKDLTSVGLDASDLSNGINIDTHTNLFGMYLPDGMVTYNYNSNDYFLTANQGAYRDYTAYSEVERVQNLVLNFPLFPTWPTIQHDSVLGRLHVTTSLGDNDNNGSFDSLYCFGGRSFSIWDENLQLVWDSGDDFEQALKTLQANNFNSEATNNSSRKGRSDDMGPEPSAIAIGEVDGKTYAFIALLEMGGIMIYDISDPNNPQFVMYQLDRDFSQPANTAAAGDLGPSDLQFVKGSDNSRGLPLLYVANRVSGTITVYEMGSQVGLNDPYPLDQEVFYPNPSSGLFQTGTYGDFEVYNAHGQLVRTVKNSKTIDLSDQAAGYYLIRNREGSSIKVIKK